MILDFTPLSLAETAREIAPMRPAPAGAVRDSGSAPAGSAVEYSTVRDEVEAEKGKSQTVPTSTGKGFSPWQNGDFSFGDFIDVINPLQHIPIVATIYRNLSGDQIGMVPRVVGGALWGRIGGFVSGIINSAMEWITGKDIGDHIYTAIWSNPEARAFAQAPKPEPRTAAPAVVESSAAPAPADSGDKASLDIDRHSQLWPMPVVADVIAIALYRDDSERDSVRAKAPIIRLSA